MLTDGDRSAVPTMKVFNFSARGLHTRPADFLEAVGAVGRSSLAGMMLAQSLVNCPLTRRANSSAKSGYALP
jgi:hypothetical protein